MKQTSERLGVKIPAFASEKPRQRAYPSKRVSCTAPALGRVYLACRQKLHPNHIGHLSRGQTPEEYTYHGILV
jgi:hypothetical protein